MEAKFIEDGEIPVACDTGIFGEVLHKNAPWLEDFRLMAKSDVVVSLADHALAEIINQLEGKRITEAEYAEAIVAYMTSSRPKCRCSPERND